MSDSQATLKTLPDWGYLLREFYELYRYLPAGGSLKIRSHQRQVREAVNRVIRADARVAPQPRAEKPVTAHLRRAIDQGLGDRMAGLVRTIDAVAGDFSWQYGYEKVPKAWLRSMPMPKLQGLTGRLSPLRLFSGSCCSRRIVRTLRMRIRVLPKAMSACQDPCRKTIRASTSPVR